MSDQTRMSLAAIEDLARRVLMAAGAKREQSVPLAVAITQAERDRIASHGLLYLPVYVEHVRCGKVDGSALPTVEQPRRNFAGRRTDGVEPGGEQAFEVVLAVADMGEEVVKGGPEISKLRIVFVVQDLALHVARSMGSRLKPSPGLASWGWMASGSS